MVDVQSNHEQVFARNHAAQILSESFHASLVPNLNNKELAALFALDDLHAIDTTGASSCTTN
jgi:hypothetical protein